MDEKIIALLPMKANSERVVGKNFRKFAGKPLFRWILDTLLAVERIDQIVINTDARGILRDNGLDESDRILIRDRKPEICGDLVSMNLVLWDDIENTDGSIYVMTHTTNPLISRKTIAEALRAYDTRGNGVDSVFSTNKVQSRFYREDLSPVNHDPQNLIRTQDLEAWYEENSCLYIFSKASFSVTGARIGEAPILFETPKLESVDIDEEEDWYLAESLAIRRNRAPTDEVRE